MLGSNLSAGFASSLALDADTYNAMAKANGKMVKITLSHLGGLAFSPKNSGAFIVLTVSAVRLISLIDATVSFKRASIPLEIQWESAIELEVH